MASKLSALQEEENKLNEIKKKLKDQLRRLQVEELALRSMLHSEDSSTEYKIVDVSSPTIEFNTQLPTVNDIESVSTD